jgi:hypothetical protein
MPTRQPLRRRVTGPCWAWPTGRRFTLGFFDQTAELWSDDGHLLASSHQIVYFKE